MNIMNASSKYAFILNIKSINKKALIKLYDF